MREQSNWFMRRNQVQMEIQDMLFGSKVNCPITKALKLPKLKCMLRSKMEELLGICHSEDNKYLIDMYRKEGMHQSNAENAKKHNSSSQDSIIFSNMMIFINFHPPQHPWIHREYMERSCHEPITPEPALTIQQRRKN